MDAVMHSSACTQEVYLLEQGLQVRSALKLQQLTIDECIS